MNEPPSPPRRRQGLPSAESVVAEKVLERTSRLMKAAAGEALQRYRILRTTEVDAYESKPARTEVQPFNEAFADTRNDKFTGTSRKAAKLGISTADVETFDDISDLIETLPAHREMVHHVPPITTAATSGRVAEEERNVRVRAFLYAASREDDNDFHLIVGREPSRDPVYMTMEISGLPQSSSPHFERLNGARTAYAEFFGVDLPGTSYDFYDPPVPIEVEGSLFFDMSHATGSKPGPQSLRPHMPVIWEVHPISSIAFEPE